MRHLSLLAVLLLPSVACMGVFDAEPLADTAAVSDGAAPEVSPEERAPARTPRPARNVKPKKPRTTPRPPATAPEPKPEPQPTPEPVAPPDAPGDEEGEPERVAPRGIQQVSDRSWTVTRRLADRWKESPHELANAAQVGEGWELRQARRKEAYFLGMKNKDIILEVNGKKLKTDAQLLAAYLALKNKTEFDVLFVRDGRRMTHHYRIVE